MSLNLFFAVLSEHEDRTGHNICKDKSTSKFCDVCLCLYKERKELIAQDPDRYKDYKPIKRKHR